jgi:hypothetical protein
MENGPASYTVRRNETAPAWTSSGASGFGHLYILHGSWSPGIPRLCFDSRPFETPSEWSGRVQKREPRLCEDRRRCGVG